MESVQINPRVAPDDVRVLDKLGGSLFSRNQMATMLLHAAIEAVRQNPDALKFPPKLSVFDCPPEEAALNDSPLKKGKK